MSFHIRRKFLSFELSSLIEIDVGLNSLPFRSTGLSSEVINGRDVLVV